jgi:hypothetical protein
LNVNIPTFKFLAEIHQVEELINVCAPVYGIPFYDELGKKSLFPSFFFDYEISNESDSIVTNIRFDIKENFHKEKNNFFPETQGIPYIKTGEKELVQNNRSILYKLVFKDKLIDTMLDDIPYISFSEYSEEQKKEDIHNAAINERTVDEILNSRRIREEENYLKNSLRKYFYKKSIFFKILYNDQLNREYDLEVHFRFRPTKVLQTYNNNTCFDITIHQVFYQLKRGSDILIPNSYNFKSISPWD